MIQIKALANTDTATWSDEFVKVYLNNYLAGQENEDSIRKLDSEVVVIQAQDSNKDTYCSLRRVRSHAQAHTQVSLRVQFITRAKS